MERTEEGTTITYIVGLDKEWNSIPVQFHADSPGLGTKYQINKYIKNSKICKIKLNTNYWAYKLTDACCWQQLSHQI